MRSGTGTNTADDMNTRPPTITPSDEVWVSLSSERMDLHNEPEVAMHVQDARCTLRVRAYGTNSGRVTDPNASYSSPRGFVSESRVLEKC